MRILALETSAGPGTVALLQSDQLLGELQLDRQRPTTEQLVPMIQDLLDSVQCRPADIELVAVSRGPGSFTGLRVGVTTAKTLAYALGAKVLGVNTLEVVAEQSTGAAARLWTVIDAHRRQLFAAGFRRTGAVWSLVEPTHLVNVDDWLAGLEPGIAVSGPVLESLTDRLPAGVLVENPQNWSPRAATVGHVAFHRHQQGDRDDVWKLVPDYHRPSAAEEKLDRG